MNELPELRRSLERLPEPALPEGLWNRVQEARRQSVRRRRVGMGVASLALLTVAALGLFRFPALDTTTRATPAIAMQTSGGQQELGAQVQALDQALQAAYDRGATDAEIAPMWVARNALLAGMTPAPAPRGI